jgi:hypothetical protein
VWSFIQSVIIATVKSEGQAVWSARDLCFSAPSAIFQLEVRPCAYIQEVLNLNFSQEMAILSVFCGFPQSFHGDFSRSQDFQQENHYLCTDGDQIM